VDTPGKARYLTYNEGTFMSIRAYMLVLGLSTGFISFSAAAQEANESKISEEEATKRFAEASQQYKLQEFGKALESFKELYRLTGEAVFLFNIAQCNRQLGNLEEALKGYKLFLQDAPNSELKQNAQTRVTELETAIAQKKAKEEKAALEAQKRAEEKQLTEIAAVKDAAQRNTKPFFLAAMVTGGGAVLVGGTGVMLGQIAQRRILKATSADDKVIKRANLMKDLSAPLAIAGDILGGVAIASVATGIIIGRKSGTPETVRVVISPSGGELVVRF
jgi:tetratricopeptide (TPR) repeat protein